MARVKRGVIKTKKRRKLLKLAKGYKWGRKNTKRRAKEAVLHSFQHSYQGRKQKKRDFRRLWNVRLNAILRTLGSKYSEFIHLLKNNQVELNRKVLSELAKDYPQTFSQLLTELKR